MLRTGPFGETEATPSQLRWSPFPIPDVPTDFLDGIITIGGNGSAAEQSGMAVHIYAANASMTERYFYNADGEMLIVPQQGRACFVTELGILEVDNGEIAIIPRGLRFRVELPDGLRSRGYICENYGQALRCSSSDRSAPTGWPMRAISRWAPVEKPTRTSDGLLHRGREISRAICGRPETTRSPLSVVAWHGNFTPYKYDLARFKVIGTISFDHPDPSIFSVLTAPSDVPGTANIDFVIFLAALGWSARIRSGRRGTIAT